MPVPVFPRPIFPFPIAEARPLSLVEAAVDPSDLAAFDAYLAARRGDAPALIGGYGEDRAVYRASPLFAGDGEPRSIHLGIDVWTEAGTPLRCPLDATVHSLAINDQFGDYGGTIILDHGEIFALYGHLAHRSLAGLREGQAIAAGERFAWLGGPAENGGWPPHLHLQCITDLGGRRGDYPGVAAPSERDAWLRRCPDPVGILL